MAQLSALAESEAAAAAQMAGELAGLADVSTDAYTRPHDGRVNQSGGRHCRANPSISCGMWVSRAGEHPPSRRIL